MSPSSHIAQVKMKPEKLGECYERAGMFMFTSDDGAKLVHGATFTFQSAGRKHAWVVLPNGRIWEPTGKMEWDPAKFERAFRPQIHNSYEFEAMNRNSQQHGHWGPWE